MTDVLVDPPDRGRGLVVVADVTHELACEILYGGKEGGGKDSGCRVAPRIPPKAPPQIRTRPFRASGSSGLGFCCPLLAATVALTRLLMTLSSFRVSQWQFLKPPPPFATPRLPRVAFPSFP